MLSIFSYNCKSQTPCTPPAAPVVISPVNYCQNSTAIQLTATGSNLIWGNGTQGSVGGTSTLTNITWVDASYNNKKQTSQPLLPMLLLIQ
ncbi:MAG: hypothetical protein WDM71_05860 [Ferruginibacter sp.]